MDLWHKHIPEAEEERERNKPIHSSLSMKNSEHNTNNWLISGKAGGPFVKAHCLTSKSPSKCHATQVPSLLHCDKFTSNGRNVHYDFLACALYDKHQGIFHPI